MTPTHRTMWQSCTRDIARGGESLPYLGACTGDEAAGEVASIDLVLLEDGLLLHLLHLVIGDEWEYDVLLNCQPHTAVPIPARAPTASQRF